MQSFLNTASQADRTHSSASDPRSIHAACHSNEPEAAAKQHWPSHMSVSRSTRHPRPLDVQEMDHGRLYGRLISCQAADRSLRQPCAGPSMPQVARSKQRAKWSFPPLARIANLVLALFAVALLRPVSAARVAFDNCLDNSWRLKTDPVLLQWVPLWVDASFNPLTGNGGGHKLKVSLYGNITGSLSLNPLPAYNSPDWFDDTKHDGKILRIGDSDPQHPMITTLHSKINVLTYEPWNNDTDFCMDSLRNGSCPLSPVFNTSALANYPYGLPYVTMSNDFYSSYSFTSFSATFIIRNGDTIGRVIGCTSATITPDLGNLAWMLRVLPAVVLVLVGVAIVFAAIWSPWGTTDIFHWSSNYGRDADLLRLVTPGFGDCLQYIQFVVLTGGLSLNYPGFYQPIVSQASWSSLMFNQSFVSNAPGYQSIQDGIYTTDGGTGLQNLSQLVGISSVADIWAGMMVWLLIIIAAIIVLGQVGFGLQWVYRAIQKIPEEDLRAKNLPFTMGNVVRVVFNYFLLPVVALSAFQLVVADRSPPYTVGLAVVVLVIILGFAGWLFYLIFTTKPRAVLFDDLPTVLTYGPLYNTYSDEAAAFAMIPIFLLFLRGIAIGAVQPSGIAQVILLAICEVVQILTVHAFRPYHAVSSMNAYHVLFSALRLAAILLMISFVPTLGVTEGPRGWVGYAILLIHGGILTFGFGLNAIKTIVEVMARLAGAGGDDVTGQTRGGLSKIFGMRQLSRRVMQPGPGGARGGPSRQSYLSSTAMLDTEEASKAGYIMPSGRVRSESLGSVGILLNKRGQRSSSALDYQFVDVALPPGGRQFDSGASSFTPTTPGEMSNFSFLPSPGSRKPPTALAMDSSDPYYRPPRRVRRPTIEREGMSSPAARTRSSWTSGDWSPHIGSVAGPAAEPTTEADAQADKGATSAPQGQPPPALSFTPRADYSTREVDFYYGVRGQRLNSEVPARKLGTGPADPTGPMASAAGWLRTMLGGKTKEKGKGFEVVRSSRMPPAMKARGGEFSDESPPEGIPVAMGVLRNGPIDSDDEDDTNMKKSGIDHIKSEGGGANLLDDDRGSRAEEPDVTRIPETPPLLPGIDVGEELRLPSRIQSKASRAPREISDSDSDIPTVPEVPRKSSRRKSQVLSHSRDPSTASASGAAQLMVHHEGPAASGVQGHLHPSSGSSRLPFERTASQKRLSSASSLTATEGLSQVDPDDNSSDGNGLREQRPTSYGMVQQGRGSISRIDSDEHQHVHLVGSAAEVVDARRPSPSS